MLSETVKNILLFDQLPGSLEKWKYQGRIQTQEEGGGGGGGGAIQPLREEGGSGEPGPLGPLPWIRQYFVL